MNAVIVFAKYPEVGRVKTRLGAQIGHARAASLYKLFLEMTFEIACRLQDAEVFVAIEPKQRMSDFLNIVPAEFHLLAQRGQNLGQRLLNAFEEVFARGAKKVIALGSDSPTLPAEFVTQAFDALNEQALVLGPAEDGGYYLIGTKQPLAALFERVNWSTDSVLNTTIQRANELGLAYCLLDCWYDVDDFESLQRASLDDTSGEIRSHLESIEITDS